MHGQDESQVGSMTRELDEGVAHHVGTLVPVLAPVERDQHVARCAIGWSQGMLRKQAAKAVDAGIADVMDALGRRALREQVRMRGVARGEVQVRVAVKQIRSLRRERYRAPHEYLRRVKSLQALALSQRDSPDYFALAIRNRVW